jgi:hypothetical protein
MIPLLPTFLQFVNFESRYRIGAAAADVVVVVVVVRHSSQ